MKGLSIQYGSFDHDFDAPLSDGGPGRNITLLPDTDVQPGHYVLVEMAAGTSDAGAPLPTPDIESTINPSATNGKIALTRISTSLGCGGTMRCPTTNIVDMVGYGTATDYEGSAAAPALDNASALLRKGDGCTDGDMNNLDFDKTAPAPRNAATAAHKCSTSGGQDAGSGGNDDAGSPGDDGGSLGNPGGGGTDGGTAHKDGGAPPVQDTFGGGDSGGCAMETARTPGGPIALAFAALGFVTARRRRRRS
jgi:MYXO-CTERM domain-containing protein